MALNILKNKKISIFSAFIVLILALFSLKLTSVHAQNISINSGVNCDANAVIWCGASSVNDLISKYHNGDGHNSAQSIQNIYSYFGISSTDIDSMNSPNTQVILGYVTKGNKVYGIGNKLIATDAVTGGRQYISGSNTVNNGGTTFYTRPPSVSFLTQYLPAYVVMTNGQFVYAILSSCGNAVKATPIPVTTPAPVKPTPTPPAPTPTPTPAPVVVTPAPATPINSYCSGNTTNTNNTNSASGGNCSTNTSIVQNQQTTTIPQPASPVPPASSTPTASTTLVNTGPGSTLAVFAGATIGGIILYQTILRRRLVKIKNQ